MATIEIETPDGDHGPVESVGLEDVTQESAICGLVKRDGSSNGKARYVGLAHGTIKIVTSKNGRVTSIGVVSVVPGHFILLNSNQGFSCV